MHHVAEGSLRRIGAPFAQGDGEAGEKQRDEDRDDQPAPTAQRHLVAGLAGEEVPGVGEGIDFHEVAPASA